MPKKKIRKKNHVNRSAKILKYIAWVLSIIALILGSLVIGYYLGYDKASSNAKNKSESIKRVDAIAKIENSLKQKNEKSVNKRLQEVLREEVKQTYLSASHELDDKKLAKVPKAVERPIVRSASKPKLAIIIDDVGRLSQVKAINALHLDLTKSFLPPSPVRPNTPTLAKNESFYMVHLPMEAMNFSAEEPKTLRITDSQTTVNNRIKEIKKLFPRVQYINNHTGSKFTANEKAMNRLITALNQNHIYFVDSRTTAQTKAPKVLKNFGQKYVARDVFLDHHMDINYVKAQIKDAIRMAKTYGSCIAIGHPHPNTLEALRESKKLLQEVDLVYINQIY